MDKKDEALKLALEALEQHGCTWIRHEKPYNEAITAIREALADQDSKEKEQSKTDAFIKQIDEALAKQPAQQQEPEPDRVKFERHWRKTRGDKKANRELPRHPLQPQTYIQDSANRHWVTWQAAVRSVFLPASKPIPFNPENFEDAPW